MLPTILRALGLPAASAVLLASTALTPAAAQDVGRINAIEAQIRALQTELTRMRHNLSARDAETRAARQEAARARAEARALQRRPAAGVAGNTPGTSTNVPNFAQNGGQPATQNPQSGSGQVAQDTTTSSRTATTASADQAEWGHVSFPGGRPTWTSSDGRFSAAVGVQLHYDIGGYLQGGRLNPNRVPNKLNNFGENLRRGRIPFVFRYDDFQLNITPDFGGSPDGTPTLYEANLNWTPIKPLTLTVGYFKPWVTLQDSESSNDFFFLERPSIVEIARNIAAGDARSSFGARWAENRWFASAYLTGASYGSQSANLATPQQTGGVFRVAGRPIATRDWDLHLGFSGSVAFDIGRTASGQTITLQERPELRIDQNRLISTGAINADSANEWGPEFGLRWRSFLLQGEYIKIGVDQSRAGASPRPNLNFEGGYAEASWVLTGERRAYASSAGAFGGVHPAHPFSLREGGWGAWELVGRYSVVDLDDDVTRGRAASLTGGVFGGRQEVIGAGINWYPNNNVRFMLQWNNVTVDRLNAAGTTQIGQRFDTIALRTQVAF